jgi:hypothetical protein
VTDALQSVAFFWGKNPKAFGDDATLGTIATEFSPVARKCQRALALIWEHEAKRKPEPIQEPPDEVRRWEGKVT